MNKSKTQPVIIGPCTLYHGDCLKVMRQLEAESFDMVWTDPPYGHDNHDGDWNARLNEHRGITGQPIANDDSDGMRRVVGGMLDEAVRLLKRDCCCCCCCCGGGPKPTFAWVAQRMDEHGLQFFHSVIWDKLNPGLGWRYRRRHEMVMIAHRKGGRLAWNEAVAAQPNVIAISKPKDGCHPNVKPVDLVSKFVNQHSVGGDLVLDPFMGSGTTGVACVRLGRRFVGIEVDPKHFKEACRRIKEEVDQGILPLQIEHPKHVEVPLFSDSEQ